MKYKFSNFKNERTIEPFTLDEEKKQEDSEIFKNQKTTPNYNTAELDELKSMLLSRKDVSEILCISYVTLFNYKKRGALIPIKIQGKVFYKRQDLINLINQNSNLKTNNYEISN